LYRAVEALKCSTTDNSKAVPTLRQVEEEDGTTKLVYCCGGFKSSTTDNSKAVPTLRQVEEEDGTTNLVYCC